MKSISFLIAILSCYLYVAICVGGSIFSVLNGELGIALLFGFGIFISYAMAQTFTYVDEQIQKKVGTSKKPVPPISDISGTPWEKDSSHK